MRGPSPLPNRFIRNVPYNASSFNFQYFLFSLKLSIKCLCLLLLRLRFTHIPSSILPLITCFRRRFLHKMWPIQLPFFLFIVCRILINLTVCYSSSFLTQSAQLIFSISTTFENFPGISGLLSKVSYLQHNTSCDSNVAIY